MLEIIKAGGVLMIPIIGCSVIALAIMLERLWTLQRRRVLPDDLTRQVWEWVSRNELNHAHIQTLQEGSPLGRILSAGLLNRNRDRQIMKESIEDTGRHVVHDLERYLNLLGTIAAISPLLGLLGTVTGMVRIFAAISSTGAVGDPAALAGGISEALITTVGGLVVAIPTLVAYRFLRDRVDSLVIDMEKEAITLVDALHRRQYIDSIGRRDEPAKA
ncbi:Tol-Pal system protein TolQ [Gammaproteobacteria bacterium]|nr:MotA/TolQ/ExbB proton channel family protein [Gammaproteobacteria bacterium]QOJ31365.1 MAG: MotA/TolQ/ExbB proton channel family protein [Gammaproteobacteria bacterium]CAG0942996.1 Tol-Pal system protein TolQ [Gammaproteobacteria bacterium]